MNQTVSAKRDPWEAYDRQKQFNRPVLTSVEFTVTHLCNLRCEHCAVGDVLEMKDPADRVPLSLLFERLDEIETLDTVSITGGEPMMSRQTITETIVPLLAYAKQRGAQTQINSNLTLDLERYTPLLPVLDVLHISFNYLNAEDFADVAYVHHHHPVSKKQAHKTYARMIDNIRQLTQDGVFVSAESIISEHTYQKLSDIHHTISDLGCARHEVHPLYASDFASNMHLLSLPTLRETYHRLLDQRNPDTWILFGTLPFYACNDDTDDLELIERIFRTPNVTVRNDPDGHNRLNCSVFSGDVTVTDFGDVGALGNVYSESFQQCFDSWQEHPTFQRFNCFCPQSFCTGPHLLVCDSYYPGRDFRPRQGIHITGQ